MDPVGMERVVKNYFQVESLNLTGSAAEQIFGSHIAIQNASSNPQASRMMADYLASKGFSNTFIDEDLPKRSLRSQIIVQRGDLDAAQAVQAVMAIGEIEANSTGNVDSDLTVQVGEDWVKRQQR
jgi:polyisoprenyl-teichoic acid--peptidoglycan teichoic acid transferase